MFKKLLIQMISMILISAMVSSCTASIDLIPKSPKTDEIIRLEKSIPIVVSRNKNVPIYFQKPITAEAVLKEIGVRLAVGLIVGGVVGGVTGSSGAGEAAAGGTAGGHQKKIDGPLLDDYWKEMKEKHPNYYLIEQFADNLNKLYGTEKFFFFKEQEGLFTRSSIKEKYKANRLVIESNVHSTINVKLEKNEINIDAFNKIKLINTANKTVLWSGYCQVNKTWNDQPFPNYFDEDAKLLAERHQIVADACLRTIMNQWHHDVNGQLIYQGPLGKFIAKTIDCEKSPKSCTVENYRMR